MAALLLLAALALADDSAPAEAAAQPVPAPDATALYLDALHAWRGHDYEAALAGARAALAVDPGLYPARLLEGYALYRSGEVDTGLAALDALSKAPPKGPDDDAAIRRARTIYRRVTDRWRRDQLMLAAGQVVRIEGAYGGAAVVAGPSLDVEVPVVSDIGVRGELGIDWATGSDTFDLGGPTFAALATIHQPIGRGVWSADLGVGPVMWLGYGGYWDDGHQLYLGARAAAGLDVRFARRFGLRTELGTRYFPAVHDTLPWYGQPFDMRLDLVWWLGR